MHLESYLFLYYCDESITILGDFKNAQIGIAVHLQIKILLIGQLLVNYYLLYSKPCQFHIIVFSITFKNILCCSHNVVGNTSMKPKILFFLEIRLWPASTVNALTTTTRQNNGG